MENGGVLSEGHRQQDCTNGIFGREYNGRADCTPHGDPIGTYQRVVRVDTGILKGNGKFQRILATNFDSRLLASLDLENGLSPRSNPIQEDGGSTHSQTYRSNGLEVRVATWAVPRYKGDPSTDFLYNMSVEVEGDATQVSRIKGPLCRYMNGIMRAYNLTSR